MGEVMKDTTAVYAGLLSSKEIRLEQQIAGGQKVFGVPGDLKQVFSNQLVNAIDATPKGGRIVLRVHAARDAANDAVGVRALVADSGEGMSADVKASAFSAFFTTKAEGGTVIGLWVTKSLIEKGGGTIRCRSKQGVRSGTSMSIFLQADRRI